MGKHICTVLHIYIYIQIYVCIYICIISTFSLLLPGHDIPHTHTLLRLVLQIHNKSCLESPCQRQIADDHPLISQHLRPTDQHQGTRGVSKTWDHLWGLSSTQGRLKKKHIHTTWHRWKKECTNTFVKHMSRSISSYFVKSLYIFVKVPILLGGGFEYKWSPWRKKLCFVLVTVTPAPKLWSP